MGTLAAVDSPSVTKHVKANIAKDAHGHAIGPDIAGDPLKPGNDDDRADSTVKETLYKPTIESCKIFVHCNVEYIPLSPITILNATHGKYIVVIFDGRKDGDVPVLGVNLTYNCEENGVPVLSNLAVKPSHHDRCDGTLNIPLTAFDVPGCEENERAINSAITPDGHPVKKVYYTNTNASNCEIPTDVHNNFEVHLNSITCALGHVANPYKSLKEY